MKFLANILIKKVGINKFNKAMNICNNIEDIITSLPTLIIGYDNAKKYIKNFNILQKNYPEQNLFWTFAKNERKYDYDVDIVNFFNMALNRLVNDLSYEYINPFNCSFSDIKDILYLLYSNEQTIIFNDYNYSNLFIYDRYKKTVYGVSIDICDYIGIKREKIMKRIVHDNNKIISYRELSLYEDIDSAIKNKIYNILPIYDYFQ